MKNNAFNTQQQLKPTTKMAARKVVLITGCAKGGIGYEYCKAFAQKNCHVFATDLPQRLPEMSDLRSTENINVLDLDVTSDQSVASAISNILSKTGRIDILVNNAGVGGTGPLAELPLETIRKTWEVNSLSQLRMVQNVVPHMVAQGHGCVVNVGSVVGRVPTPWAGSYCASKAAVHAMTHTLRVELRPFGIDVVMVVPGAVKSNFGFANFEGLKGREWKIYGGFKEAIEERARASQSSKSMDGRLFAEYVASRVLRPRPPKQVVFGHLTGLFAVLSWCPLWVRDLFFSNRFKLNKVH